VSQRGPCSYVGSGNRASDLGRVASTARHLTASRTCRCGRPHLPRACRRNRTRLGVPVCAGTACRRGRDRLTERVKQLRWSRASADRPESPGGAHSAAGPEPSRPSQNHHRPRIPTGQSTWPWPADRRVAAHIVWRSATGVGEPQPDPAIPPEHVEWRRHERLRRAREPNDRAFRNVDCDLLTACPVNCHPHHVTSCADIKVNSLTGANGPDGMTVDYDFVLTNSIPPPG
jgi:hypothetical protein